MISELGSCPKVELTMACVLVCTGAPFEVATLVTTMKKNTLNIRKNTDMHGAMVITEKGAPNSSQSVSVLERLLSSAALFSITTVKRVHKILLN